MAYCDIIFTYEFETQIVRKLIVRIFIGIQNYSSGSCTFYQQAHFAIDFIKCNEIPIK